MSVIDVVASGARKEAQNIKDFVTTPKGVFETADQMIRDARSTVRGAASAAGVPTMFGQRRFAGRRPRLRGQSGSRMNFQRLRRLRRVR
ncbi:hypothetical protein ES703_14351 [subsurface metagenome]